MGAYIANPRNRPVNPFYDPYNNIVDISELFRTSQIFQQILLCLGSRPTLGGLYLDNQQPTLGGLYLDNQQPTLGGLYLDNQQP
ncbi:MAG: hypothetical protein NZ893_01810, partial [Candidatus Aenigmarchaeota archaeon]|nr:hypothetical protein [Candidatus Aenigmarchaeota archaeon]